MSTDIKDSAESPEKGLKPRSQALAFLIVLCMAVFYALHLFHKPPSSPIASYHAINQMTWKAKLSKQSKSLESAVEEYQRRYGMSPPRGFDKWFQFAKEHDFLLIDEFDQVFDDIRPFLKLTGAKVRKITEAAVDGLSYLSVIRIQDGKVKISATGLNHKTAQVERGSALVEIIEAGNFAHNLPDMTLLINERAESRVLDLQEFNLPLETRTDWAGNGTTWEYFRETCLSSGELYKAIRQPSEIFCSYISSDDLLKTPSDHFVDFCQDPLEHSLHGNFFSNYRSIKSLIPIFSPGKIVGFKDILIPSAYYWNDMKSYRYSENEDLEWENKTDKIWWRGASSGGGHYPNQFSNYHRQRLVRMSNSIPNQYRMMKAAFHSWSPYVHRADHEHLIALQNAHKTIGQAQDEDYEDEIRIDVAFTAALDCQPDCDKLMQPYRFARHSRMRMNWRHKYLVDVDGYGYSARFLPFLRSKSLILKSTINKEWFSNWVTPWVHYVPLSLRYKELAAVYQWFQGNDDKSKYTYRNEGPTVAKRIANDGSQMARKHLRKVDMVIYVYRLMLEWARVQSDDRKAMSFTGPI